MSSSKPLQDSKKFKFIQEIGSSFVDGINFRKGIKLSISSGYDSVIIVVTKKELNKLIGNLSNLEKGLKKGD